ncbi:MAG: hypothetical protein HN377_12610 [Alphaproteobacteria bacterium]|jgi:hypothetical protein|nr:hypothetical protein [Alphaproteobacteria bacterium]MBT7943357.1 hypothetical protein [Alphaproteobacteria bacterium]
MEFLFSPDAKWLWTAVLAVALFFPVRKLIWVMTVRRAIKKTDEDTVDAAEQARLMKRAGFTSGLLCFLFALFYVGKMFQP